MSTLGIFPDPAGVIPCTFGGVTLSVFSQVTRGAETMIEQMRALADGKLIYMVTCPDHPHFLARRTNLRQAVLVERNHENEMHKTLKAAA